jgi:hypothetical protein
MESAEESGVSPLPLPVLVHDLGTRTDDSQTQYSVSTQKLSTAAIAELRDYRCFETPQGWVLSLDPASLQTFLWRPQDGERIQLPPLEEVFPLRCKCLLTDKPGSPSGCFVVVFDLDTDEMWVCRIGADLPWESFRCDLDNGRRHIAKGHGVTAVGGKIYYELSGYELGTITFGSDSLPDLAGVIDVDMVDLPRSKPMGSTYLVESCGDLFLVVIFFDGYNVHKIAELTVYKMDFSQPAWCKVDGIGAQRAFLLGGDMMGVSNFGASCSAGGGLRGNCVYYLNHLATTENFLHVFDLKNGEEEVHRPFRHKGFPMPPRPPFWLLPSTE